MVRIVTDSTCDLSPERQKALEVEVVLELRVQPRVD